MELDAGWATRAGLNVLNKKKPLGPARIRHFYLPFSESTITTTTAYIMQLTPASSKRRSQPSNGRPTT